MLIWEYNIYFYPGRTYYDIDYKKETAEKILRQLENEETVNYCPDVLMKMDLYGRIVKEYSRDELYYEEAVDGLMTGAERNAFFRLIPLTGMIWTDVFLRRR